MKIALFLNGFEEIVPSVVRHCNADLAVAYIRRPKGAFHATSDLEDEANLLLVHTEIIRKAKDLLSLLKIDRLIVSKHLSVNRTLMVLCIAWSCRAKIVEFDLYKSSFTNRGFIGYSMTFLSRLFSKHTLNRFLLALSMKLKLIKLLAYPITMHVETVAVCNLRCKACATGLNALGRPQGFMDLQAFDALIKETGKYLDNLVLHLYGEPMLHKQISQFATIAKSRNVRHVEMSTNANVVMTEEAARSLIKSGLDTLIISMDGATEEVYQAYRVNGKLAMLLDFLKAVVKAKVDIRSLLPVVTVQFILMKQNEHQLAEARELVMSLGADSFRVKNVDPTFADIGEAQGQALLPTADGLFSIQEGKLKSRIATNKNFCQFVWNSATVTWDGHMIPCCFDEKGSVVLGDAFHPTWGFRKSWNAKPYLDFRKQIITNRQAIPLCKDCPYV